MSFMTQPAATFGIRLVVLPYEEESEVHADADTTLGSLKTMAVATSSYLPEDAELKAWFGDKTSGTPLIDNSKTLGDYNLTSATEIHLGLEYPEQVSQLVSLYE